MLISYLQKRSIDIETAKLYCQEIRYRIRNNPAVFYAVGFRNDAGGWEFRNPKFKCCSSPKNITTIRNGSDTVMVFEGFMDFLSYLTFKNKSKPMVDSVVLNSVTNLQKAIPFLKKHKTVHVFFDNDDAGRNAISQLRMLEPDVEIIDQSYFYRNYNDLNDYLTAQLNQKITSCPEQPKIPML